MRLLLFVTVTDMIRVNVLMAAGMAALGFVPTARGQIVQSEPFLGVKLFSITQTLPRPLNIRLVEIDLAHPDVRFRVSPLDPGLPGGNETITQPTRQYVNEQSAQIGINTSFFYLINGGQALPTNNNGLSVSDGHAYSPWDDNAQVGFNIARNNVASIVTPASVRPTGVETNPATASLFNAGAGSHRLLNNGANVAPANSDEAGHFLHLQPRTALGITPTNKLLLATIDGRRSGFSEGMYLREVASLLETYGATNAINLDGGGSTTMAMDYYGDGPTRAQLVNRPSGSERYNGASLGVFANRNPNFIAPTGSVHVPTTVGSIRILDDFEDSNGHFRNDPDFSGSNRGLLKTTTFDGPSTAARDANHALHGFAAHRIDLVSQDHPTWDGFRLRHLSGGGSPGQNEQLGTSGFVGFWIKTTTEGLLASIGLDENGTSTIESGIARQIIADGEWRLYEWNLADAEQWESFFNGDGVIDGPSMTVDSIFISSPLDQDATVWVDALSYNPNGSLGTLVPEPGGITAAGIAGIMVLSRRRRRRA